MGGWTYDSGQFNLYCDVCKRKIKAEEARNRWDGLIVCPDDWEPRQPQDFVKAKIDKIAVPFSRPVEVTSNDITYGMFDVVKFNEKVFVGILTYLPIVETFKVTDSNPPPTIGKKLTLADNITITDSFTSESFLAITQIDTIELSEGGWLYMDDYVDPTYFLEYYVGLKYYI